MTHNRIQLNLCLRCSKICCKPCEPAPMVKMPEQRTVHLASDEELRSLPLYLRVGIAVANLCDSPGEVLKLVLDAYLKFPGDIRDVENKPVQPSYDEIIRVLGGEDGLRWTSRLLNFTTDQPRYKPSKSAIVRLRLILGALDIDFPRTASHIRK